MHDLNILQYTINNSIYFDKFLQYKLTINMRLNKDQQHYRKWLAQLGRATSNYDGRHVKVPSEWQVQSIDELIDTVFPRDMRDDQKKLAKRAILAVHNNTVAEINQRVYNVIPGDEQEFIAVITNTRSFANQDSPVEYQRYIENLSPPELPPHVLKLKRGCIVMLLRNIDTQNKLCNGTKLSVDKWHTEGNVTILECANLSAGAPKKCFIPRIVLAYEDKRDGTCMTRRQFPIRIAYRKTVNKSLGQTLDFVGLHMYRHCFSHGQLYVAFSRVRSSDHIKVFAPEENICTGMSSIEVSIQADWQFFNEHEFENDSNASDGEVCDNVVLMILKKVIVNEQDVAFEQRKDARLKKNRDRRDRRKAIANSTHQLESQSQQDIEKWLNEATTDKQFEDPETTVTEVQTVETAFDTQQLIEFAHDFASLSLADDEREEAERSTLVDELIDLLYRENEDTAREDAENTGETTAKRARLEMTENAFADFDELDDVVEYGNDDEQNDEPRRKCRRNVI